MPEETMMVGFPVDLKALHKWTEEMSKAVAAAHRFQEFAKFFFNRDLYDCRLTRYNEETRERDPTGEFYDGPLRHGILEGTEEERAKGFFLNEDTEYDSNPEFTRIRPYTISTPLGDKMFHVPTDGYIEHNPRYPAYEAVKDIFKFGHCSRVFIVQGSQSGEDVAMFFPVKWGSHENCYLMIMVGGRYSETDFYLFQGDPAEWARYRKRGPRSNTPEVDLFFSEDRPRGEHVLLENSVWPLHEAPAEITMDIERYLEDGTPVYEPPHPFCIEEYPQAVSRYKSIEYRYGMPYLLDC